MISVKCPHCKVGLKIDETRVPDDIESFKCPKCKQEIPLSYINRKVGQDDEEETKYVHIVKNVKGLGRLTVIDDDSDAVKQEYRIREGVMTVGREAKTSTADICIKTSDKTMSRHHIKIETKKNPKGKGFLYCLSDNNSKNNTLYNGKYLEEGDIVILKDNDEIILGNTKLRFNE